MSDAPEKIICKIDYDGTWDGVFADMSIPFLPSELPDDATEYIRSDLYEALQARIAELEGVASYVAGTNTDHVRCALAGNPSVVEEIYFRALAALTEDQEGQ